MKMHTFYKYVYIFIVCCVVGFSVETLWCLIRHGYIESRKSLVYGPLSVAYGMGGVLLTAVLSKFTDAPLWKVFVISFIVGSVALFNFLGCVGRWLGKAYFASERQADKHNTCHSQSYFSVGFCYIFYFRCRPFCRRSIKNE